MFMKKLSTLNYHQLRAVILDFSHQCSESEREQILLALSLAEDIHVDQVRPEGPYINHVLRVAARLIFVGVTTTDVIIAALLHDGPEDQAEKILDFFSEKATSDDIQKLAINVLEGKFGSDVSGILKLVTNPEFPSKDKEEKNALYVEHVREIVYKNPKAGILKLSDFYDNGMNLLSVSDLSRRVYLAGKYAPLFEIFIEALPMLSSFFSLRNQVAAKVKRDLEKEFSFVKKQF